METDDENAYGHQDSDFDPSDESPDDEIGISR